MMSRTAIISAIGILILTYNITAQGDADDKKTLESENYFVETLNYYFPWTKSWVNHTPEDIDEADITDDYCVYPNEISRLMEEQKTYHIELKQGWRTVPHKTSYFDHISGMVVDEQGVPRVTYRGKTAIYDSYLYANCISRERGAELKAEMDRTNNNVKIEGEAYAQLEVMMGEEVFNRFAIQLSSLIYGGSCYIGHGAWMSAQVTPVLAWYTRATGGAENQILTFLKGKFKDTQAAERLRNFIEIFVEHNDLAFLQNICSQRDVGALSATLEVPTESNLYLTWKKLKNEEM